MVPAVFSDGNWSRQVDLYGNPVEATTLSTTLFPTTADVDNFLATQALTPAGFIVENDEHTDPGTAPGTDPGVDPGTEEGIPVFSLTGDQVSFLTDWVIAHPGNFAIDVFMDPFTYLESMQLIEVSDYGLGGELVPGYN